MLRWEAARQRKSEEKDALYLVKTKDGSIMEAWVLWDLVKKRVKWKYKETDGAANEDKQQIWRSGKSRTLWSSFWK